MDEDGFLSFDGPFVRLLNGAADHPEMLKLQYFLGMYRQDFLAVQAEKTPSRDTITLEGNCRR